MNYFLGVAFILILLFLIRNFIKKRNLKKFKTTLLKNWGKEKKENYYNFFAIARYFNNNEHKENAYHLISEKNKIDLDIDALF